MMMQVQQQARRTENFASNTFTSFNRDVEESSEEEEEEESSGDSMGIIEGEDSDLSDRGVSDEGGSGSGSGSDGGSLSGNGSVSGEDNSEDSENETDRLNPRPRRARRRRRRRDERADDLEEEDDRRSMRRVSSHNVDPSEIAVGPDRDNRYRSRSSEIKADDWGTRRLANPKAKVSSVVADGWLGGVVDVVCIHVQRASRRASSYLPPCCPPITRSPPPTSTPISPTPGR